MVNSQKIEKSSTSLPGVNLVDGLPPVSSFDFRISATLHFFEIEFLCFCRSFVFEQLFVSFSKVTYSTASFSQIII